MNSNEPRFSPWIRETILWGAPLVIGITVAILTNYIISSEEAFKAILLGALTSIIIALITVRIAWHLRTRKMEQNLQNRLKTVSDITSSLAKLEEGSEFLNPKSESRIFDHIDGVDRPSVMVAKSLMQWAQYATPKDPKYPEAANDLWKVTYRVYAKEECRDIEFREIASNLQIYIHLLSAFMKYFLCSHGKRACVFIVTTLLPSQWYKEDSWHSDKEFNFVENYRVALTEVVRQGDEPHQKPDLMRAILVKEREEPFKTFTDLVSDLRKNPEEANRYIHEIHFSRNQAVYYRDDPPKGIDLHSDCRDLLIFGHQNDRGDRIWDWGVKATLTPEHQTMLIKLLDAKSLHEKGVFAPDLSMIEIINTVTTRVKRPDFHLDKLMQKVILESRT